MFFRSETAWKQTLRANTYRDSQGPGRDELNRINETQASGVQTTLKIVLIIL